LLNNESVLVPLDKDYLEMAKELIEDVLSRVKDLELEKAQKNATIELLQKLLD
jgi:hypothetical protein